MRKWDGCCYKDWTSVYEQCSEKWVENISDSLHKWKITRFSKVLKFIIFYLWYASKQGLAPKSSADLKQVRICWNQTNFLWGSTTTVKVRWQIFWWWNFWGLLSKDRCWNSLQKYCWSSDHYFGNLKRFVRIL